MANDRYRYEQNRYRDQNPGEREDDGYIARRGFGNARSGYSREDDSRHDRSRERDFGDSAGYGSGGSTLDWHEVVGSDRSRRSSVFGGDDRNQDWGHRRSASAHGRDRDRQESSYFGRGSRDYGEERGFFERAGDEISSWFSDDEAERGPGRTMQGGQHHRGRGPKGYQRSDQRILEDVNDRLTDDPHLDASEIDVSVSNREVTLNGTVNSRFEKRHAEDLAESVSGVTHVQNNLRIQQYADAGMGGSMLSGADTGGAGAGTTGIPDTGTTGMTGSRDDASSTSAGSAPRREPGSSGT